MSSFSWTVFWVTVLLFDRLERNYRFQVLERKAVILIISVDFLPELRVHAFLEAYLHKRYCVAGAR